MSRIALALAMTLAVAPLIARSQPAPVTPAGTWEGVLESPRRPVVLTLTLEADGAGLKGRLRFSGQQALLVNDAVLESSELSFTVGTPPMIVRARVEERTMSGTLTQGNQPLPFRLEREPDLPKPADRVEAWRQDLEVAARKLPLYDRSLSAEEAKEYRAAMAGLQANLAKKSDAEIVAGLAQAVALARNAHTRLYILRNRTELRRLPLRLWWFGEELRVLRATAEHRELAGCRVTGIAGHTPQRVREAVAPLFAGNDSWREYKSVYSMTSPEILAGLGLAADMENIEWRFRCGTRDTRAVIAPLPLAKSSSPTEAWWELSPARGPSTAQEWVSAPVAAPLPLYLRYPEKFYWHEYLAEEQALYVNYSRSQQMTGGPTLQEFGATIARDVADKPVKRMVIDLRFNTGGDSGLGRAVMEELHALAQKKGAAMVAISGRTTFSAGLFHLVQWKEWGATIVGEPAGDVLDYWSEGGNIILPNSRLYVHYANGFHTYSKAEYPQFKPYFSDMSVDSVAPDVPVRMTWEQYIRGEDPALRAALRPR